jgi:glycosyltransferase involved in cell wall biosynthesis
MVEHLARELKICNRITFVGKVRDTSHVLEISDLFILPSETESFGLAALEAMAEGVPVISSNTGGIPEVNVEGVSGYLSNVGDVDEMASNALKILSSNENLQKFRINALNRAKDFTLEKILPMYETLYESVLK